MTKCASYHSANSTTDGVGLKLAIEPACDLVNLKKLEENSKVLLVQLLATNRTLIRRYVLYLIATKYTRTKTGNDYYSAICSSRPRSMPLCITACITELSPKCESMQHRCASLHERKDKKNIHNIKKKEKTVFTSAMLIWMEAWSFAPIILLLAELQKPVLRFTSMLCEIILIDSTKSE